MKKFIICLLLCLLYSCALPINRSVEKKAITRVDKILECVERFRGEGFKRSYEVCKDLHTLD